MGLLDGAIAAAGARRARPTPTVVKPDPMTGAVEKPGASIGGVSTSVKRVARKRGFGGLGGFSSRINAKNRKGL